MTNMGGCRKIIKKKKWRQKEWNGDRERGSWGKIFPWLAVIWQALRPLSLNLISLLFAYSAWAKHRGRRRTEWARCLFGHGNSFVSVCNKMSLLLIKIFILTLLSLSDLYCSIFSGILWTNFSRIGRNDHLESTMNWLDSCRERSKPLWPHVRPSPSQDFVILLAPRSTWTDGIRSNYLNMYLERNACRLLICAGAQPRGGNSS